MSEYKMIQMEHTMIKMVLDMWRTLNSNPNVWASFEAVRFTAETRCAIKWGYILSDGTKETVIQTIVWTLYDNGRYEAAVKLNHV